MTGYSGFMHLGPFPCLTACLLFTACREECETRVEGGTADEWAIVDSAVATFKELLVADLQICVPEVKIVNEIRNKVGRYDPITHRARVSTISDDVVYHELCHAVQMQNNLSVDGPNWIMSSEYKNYLGMREGALSPRKEAFAYTCASGPTYAFLLQESCPDDPPGADALFEVQALFEGPDARIDLDRQGTFTPTVVLPTHSTSFDLQLTHNGVRLTVDDNYFFVDPWTGNSISEEPIVEHFSFDEAVTSDLSVLWLRPLVVPNGAVAKRRSFAKNKQSVPLGCLKAEERVFEFDDWLWSAWIEEGTVVAGYWMIR